MSNMEQNEILEETKALNLDGQNEPLRMRKNGWQAATYTPNITKSKSLGMKLESENVDKQKVIEKERSIEDEEKMNVLLKRKEDKLEDLLQTEERYFGDLKKIWSFFKVNMKKSKDDPEYYVKMPEELKEMDYILIGNFQEVFDFHKDVFTEELRGGIKCAEKIRNLLRKRKYDMKNRYGKYCNNWKK